MSFLLLKIMLSNILSPFRGSFVPQPKSRSDGGFPPSKGAGGFGRGSIAFHPCQTKIKSRTKPREGRQEKHRPPAPRFSIGAERRKRSLLRFISWQMQNFRNHLTGIPQPYKKRPDIAMALCTRKGNPQSPCSA